MKLSSCYRSVCALALFSVVCGLVSCASGPTYAEAAKTLPPIPKGKGRVFVYRPSALGAAVKPKINIDNQPVGTSTAQGFSYSDQTPGSHEISLTTEWTHKNNFVVAPGQLSFVRTDMKFGVLVGHLSPVSVDKKVGENEIQSCKLVTP